MVLRCRNFKFVKRCRKKVLVSFRFSVVKRCRHKNKNRNELDLVTEKIPRRLQIADENYPENHKNTVFGVQVNHDLEWIFYHDVC